MLDTQYLRPLKLDTVSSKIKIVCLSIWYPLAMSRYFEKALRARYDVDLITTGPYTGAWIPWRGGMNVPEKYAKPPDIPLPFRNDIGRVNYDLVRAQLPAGWIPDIVLTIDAGICWKSKPLEGQVVHIATDPHVLNYDFQRTLSDKFFNMQSFYSQKGDIYLPYAYSKYDCYPEPMTDETGIEQAKDTDAVLIGLQYDQRATWIQELRKRGVSVIAENGPVYDEARALYNRGRIGLNWSSMQDLNCRAFEIPAMGLYPVLNVVPDMEKFGIWDTAWKFRDLNEAIEAVVWAKEHPDLARKDAEECYEKVLPHTYDARVTQMLEQCGYV